MKVSILFASLRKNSNTKLLLQPFVEKLESENIEVDFISLKELKIDSCSACWLCQDNFLEPGCSKHDDMHIIYKSVLESDCIIFATPIYSWYCTPPLKAAMDRLVYGMNKYYGKKPGPCLWKGKQLGIVTTCGYEISQGAGVFEEGVKRYAEHSNLNYLGMLAVRDTDTKAVFSNEETISLANQYANKVIEAIK